jgi:hypothetical protein
VLFYIGEASLVIAADPFQESDSNLLSSRLVHKFVTHGTCLLTDHISMHSFYFSGVGSDSWPHFARRHLMLEVFQSGGDLYRKNAMTGNVLAGTDLLARRALRS